MKTKLYLTMLFLSLAGFRNSEAKTISGTVYDHDDRKPIPGVSISIEGTHLHFNADANGHYSVVVADNQKVLIFSFIGYNNQRVKIGSSNQIDVWLMASRQMLKEIVVTGYAIQRKQSMTSSFTTLNPKTSAAWGNYGANTDSESYKKNPENKFIDPKTSPLSTFAADVDAASYSNFRRFINGGQLPPKDAVKIEEMINYFQYDLAGPKNKVPVAIHTELSCAPWSPAHRLLRIGIKAKSIKTDQLPSSNLVFLLDVSGSMSDVNKLPLVKAAMKLLVDQLRPIDHIAIVTYADGAGLKLASTSGNQKTKIKNVIDDLQASGSTAGGEGIKMAYRIAKENYIKNGNNRIILATDGDFNVGASSDEDMEQMIIKENSSGISISVLGFGMGNLKDSKMNAIADKGHGNYAYIDNITEARKAMVTEFGATLFTVAKDVKIQVEFNPAKVQAYRLIGYENHLMEKEDFNNDKKLGSDMGVGHTVTALYEIIPAGLKDDYSFSVDPLKYQKTEKASTTNSSSELVTIKFRYKTPDGEKSAMEKVSVNDTPVPILDTSDDFRFASAVAELGQILSDSAYKQHSDFENLISRAKAAKGKDEEGYRAEFINLAKNAREILKSSEPEAK
ncbi:von Willebrand factor type A domain-containing protein [Pedobacter sp. UYP1]|uniref:vWA domain-containing protein n=1 Tax=Pedobacter sp. UYP1 TaxID=1756396 RepID=UPI003396A87E